MNDYIATFYSHFGALSLCKELQSCEVTAELVPVPRELSTSCGVCVQFCAPDWAQVKEAIDLEVVYRVHEAGSTMRGGRSYEELFRA